ncbi:MAG TPA: chromate efflux transporter [Candidatus Dormibacteraeota bacterium]
MSSGPRPGALRVALVLLKVGVIAFGGPVTHVAFMRRELVERRRWLDQETFLRMFAACNLIPGPSSTELAIFAGYRLAGWPGLLLSGALFIAPAMAAMLAIAWAYARFGTSAVAVAALGGVRPIVVGIVAWALLDLGRRIADRALGIVLAALTGLLSLLGMNPVLLLVAGGLALLAVRYGGTWLRRGDGTGCLSLAGGPGLVLLAHGERLPVLFWTFLEVGAVSFGSGYVLFAYLHADFVQGLHWLTPLQLADAIAIGQVTPGPVFTTATFLGYLFAGVAGALVGTVAIFLPGFVLVPFLDRIVRLEEASPPVRTFLDGVNMAVIGLIAAVTLQLGLSSIRTPMAAVVAVACFAILLRQPLATPVLVLAGAALGLLSAGAF